MELSELRSLVVPIVAADRTDALADLREGLVGLRGDAAARGRLRSGFFVGDMRRLCEKYVNRRAEEILAAYDAVLSTARGDPAPQTEGIVESMTNDLTADLELIEQEFQSNLHPDHLPVGDAMGEAARRASDRILAQGPVLVRKHMGAGSQGGVERRSEPQSDSEEIIELKPNLWGFGINLRALGRRLRLWWRKRAAG